MEKEVSNGMSRKDMLNRETPTQETPTQEIRIQEIQVQEMLIKEDDTYLLRHEEWRIPFARVYQNHFHMNNTYLEFLPETYEPYMQIGDAVIAEISRREKTSLQVMASSENTSLTTFLCTCGFVVKRRCYECRYKREDLVDDSQLSVDAAASLEIIDDCCEDLADGYERTAHLLYRYYQATHRDISPLTVPFEIFSAMLPSHVCLLKTAPSYAAFVEDNEIAYVCGELDDAVLSRGNGTSAFAAPLYQKFLTALLSRMFALHTEITFECDDVDPLATALMNRFRTRPEHTFDTYVYESR